MNQKNLLLIFSAFLLLLSQLLPFFKNQNGGVDLTGVLAYENQLVIATRWFSFSTQCAVIFAFALLFISFLKTRIYISDVLKLPLFLYTFFYLAAVFAQKEVRPEAIAGVGFYVFVVAFLLISINAFSRVVTQGQTPSATIV